MDMSAPPTFNPRKEPLVAFYALTAGIAHTLSQAMQAGGKMTVDDLVDCRLAVEAMLWTLESFEGVQSRALEVGLPFAGWRATELLQVELRNTKGNPL